MLTISGDLQAKIIAHARKDHPDEACGVIAGPIGSDRPQRFIPMQNAERSPTFYRFDSLEQLKVWREMDDRDEEAIVIYHSHTATEAYPSRTDISYASEPQAHYVLVSTRDEQETEFRSYRIADGEVTEEPVHVTELRVPKPGCHPRHIKFTEERCFNGHTGSHPDDPAHLHRRRQVGRGIRVHPGRAADQPGR